MNSRTLVFTLSICVGLSACSDAKFTSAEEAALKKSVFTGEELQSTPDDYTASINQPAGGNNPATGSVTQPPTNGSANGSVPQPPANGSANGSFPQIPGFPSLGSIAQLISAGSASGSIPQMPSMPANGSVSTTPSNPANGSVSSNPGGTSMPGTEPISAQLQQLIDSEGVVKLSYVCTAPQNYGSEAEPAMSGANTSDKLSIKVNGEVCSADTAKILAQLKAKQLDLKKLCPNLAAEISSFALLVNDKVNTIIDTDISTIDFIQTWNNIPKTVGILYASPHSMTADLAKCDATADPLTVHVGRGAAGPIQLSDRFNGVDFDLLGRTNRHVQVRTAWFQNNDYGFLALPNAKGEVKGIDQLFGDNTYGPDRKFAKHGYDALAKYDSNRDGRIDKNDSVFSSLRVWVDRDRNGVAHASELLTLKEAEIEYIRLDYRTDFSETDRHGNTTNMKSIIGRPDGSLDVIFDLWLTYSRK